VYYVPILGKWMAKEEVMMSVTMTVLKAARARPCPLNPLRMKGGGREVAALRLVKKALRAIHLIKAAPRFNS